MNRGPYASYAGFLFLLSGVSGAACQNANRDETVQSSGNAVVSPSSPLQSPATSGSIPPLARRHGVLAAGAATDTSALAAHEGVFTDGTDLPGAPAFSGTLTPPASLSCPGSDPRCAWIQDATSDPYASAPALGARLTEALGDASNELSKLDASTIDDILSALSYLPGVTTHTSAPEAQFLGYDSESARWLHSASMPLFCRLGGGCTGGTTTYADPLALASHRERGARLYCAAREAQLNHQSSATKSMGKQSAFSFTLFGQQIDVLSVEPTVVLDGPGPFVGLPPRCPAASGCPAGAAPDDGAQAFTVPFLFGAQITPISFLPSLAEVRYPVTMVSGDTEVQTTVNRVNNLLFESKSYQTATHTDALVTEQAGGNAKASFPLAQIGPVQIDFGFNLDIGVGVPATGSGSVCGLNFSNPPLDSRGLVPPSPNTSPSWPTSVRSGHVSDLYNYDDGPWLLGGGSPASYVGSNAPLAFNIQSSEASQYRYGALAAAGPFLVRALQDDDRLASTMTTLALGASVTGSLGGPIGPLDIDLSATGTLCGAVGLRHTLRDAVIGAGGGQSSTGIAVVNIPPTPIQNVTIAPSTLAGASLDFDVHLTIQLDVLFGTITLVNADLINATVPLAQYDTLSDPTKDPWTEAHQLRIGTGSPLGAPMVEPSVLSHLPNAGQFASFPETVDQCLANPAANPPAPPTCGSVPPAASGPVQTNVCVFNKPIVYGILNSGTGSGDMPALPANPCSNVAAYAASVGGTAAQQQCASDYLTFLCTPVSQAQTFENAQIVAREFLTNDTATNTSTATALQSIVNECVAANVTGNPVIENLNGAAQTFAQGLFSFGFCDGSANLLPSGQVLSGPTDPTQPPTVGAGTCH